MGRYAIAPCGTAAGARRHYRHGEKPCSDCATAARVQRSPNGYATGRESRVPDLREIRNGLPFRPYVYRGTGADAYTGEVVL